MPPRVERGFSRTEEVAKQAGAYDKNPGGGTAGLPIGWVRRRHVQIEPGPTCTCRMEEKVGTRAAINLIRSPSEYLRGHLALTLGTA